MNRREFNRAALSSLAAALVPSWVVKATPPKAIDLSEFCAAEAGFKYDMTAPFVQMDAVDDKIGRKSWQQAAQLPGSHLEPFRFATDGRVCVRVPANDIILPDSGMTKLPPANTLPWRHNWPIDGKWLKWPRANYLLAADSCCPACDGTGCTSRKPQPCCRKCEGQGEYWTGGFYSGTWVNCTACDGRGILIKNPCPHCKGNAIGNFPSVQRIESGYVECDLHRRIDTLPEVEYFVSQRAEDGAVRFRFHGGHGLVMPLDVKTTEKRLVKARQ